MAGGIAYWLSALKDLAVAGAAVATAFFAYKGLSAWRSELKGKAEYQIAKDVLRAVYKVRDAFMVVRNPAIWQAEYPDEAFDDHGNLKPGGEPVEAVYQIGGSTWLRRSKSWRRSIWTHRSNGDLGNPIQSES